MAWQPRCACMAEDYQLGMEHLDRQGQWIRWRPDCEADLSYEHDHLGICSASPRMLGMNNIQERTHG